MSKIIKNNGASPVAIADVGITIPAASSYTIPAQDYLLWAASSHVITHVGSGALVVNDGSADLSISDGIDLIKGLFPNPITLRGNTDGTKIGNSSDKLKVYDADAITVLNGISAGLGVSTSSILRQNEVAVTSRAESDISGTTYTVPVGKKFLLTSFAASYDANAAMHIRLKKQTGGTGPFVTLFRMTLMAGGQGDSTLSYNFGNGINIGQAGDVFKLTVESSIAKGTVWAEYSGTEV